MIKTVLLDAFLKATTIEFFSTFAYLEKKFQTVSCKRIIHEFILVSYEL